MSETARALSGRWKRAGAAILICAATAIPSRAQSLTTMEVSKLFGSVADSLASAVGERGQRMAEQIEARIRRGGSIHGTQDTLDPEERTRRGYACPNVPRSQVP